MPLDELTLRQIVDEFGTPLFVYDLAAMRTAAVTLQDAFSWSPGFQNFFAVKALPRLSVLRYLRDCGQGVECCSLPELVLAEKAGFGGSQVIYTCLYPLPGEIEKARTLRAAVNLDYTENLPLLLRSYSPQTVYFRLNPGAEIGGGPLLGEPQYAKFGSTAAQLIDAARKASAGGVEQLGVHGMFASNVLDLDYVGRAIDVLFRVATRLRQSVRSLNHIDLGGGIGIPYRAGDTPVDAYALGNLVRDRSRKLLGVSSSGAFHLSMECGRYVVGPHGVLVTRVLQVKKTYKTFVFVDASATNYPRPGVFGGYNSLTVLGRSTDRLMTCDVVGLLCDNFDRFCVDRTLPEVTAGDLIVVHDAGAHAAAMSYDYNGRLKCREVLVKEDGAAVLIRQAQTVDGYVNE